MSCMQPCKTTLLSYEESQSNRDSRFHSFMCSMCQRAICIDITCWIVVTRRLLFRVISINVHNIFQKKAYIICSKYIVSKNINEVSYPRKDTITKNRLPEPPKEEDITKTCLFKYIETFITKKGKLSYRKILIFFIFLLKTQIVGTR